jgi:hypothetical protein
MRELLEFQEDGWVKYQGPDPTWGHQEDREDVSAVLVCTECGALVVFDFADRHRMHHNRLGG